MIPIVFPASEPALEAIDIDRIVSPDFAAGFADRLKRQGMSFDSLTARSQFDLFDVVFFSFVEAKVSFVLEADLRFDLFESGSFLFEKESLDITWKDLWKPKRHGVYHKFPLAFQGYEVVPTNPFVRVRFKKKKKKKSRPRIEKFA